MLKKQALKKILITSLTVVILLMIYIMPSNVNSINKLKVNKTVEYVESKVGYIYLLNDNDFLVKADFLIDEYKDNTERIKCIINNLIDTSTVPKGLKNIIPKKTKIKGISINDDNIIINFSKDILDVSEEQQEKLIESIAFSIFEIDEVKSISILVENENINKYFKNVPNIITRDFGINKKYNITCLKDIQKVVVYYINEIDNKRYLVPVTNYINDNEEKIKIIIESLSSKYIYEPNLISLLNNGTELINYEIKDDMMQLNFNNSIFMSDGNILEEVIYTIGNSIFDSYDVNKVIFNVENRFVYELVK